MSKYKKKVKQINNITFKVKVKAELTMALRDRLDYQDKIISKLQKELISWWSKQTDKRFILIVDYGNLVKGTDNFSYKIDLTQLNLDKETIDRFKKGAEEKVFSYLKEFGTIFV